MRQVSVSLVCLPEVEASTLYGAGDAFVASGGLWKAMTGTEAPKNCIFVPETVGHEAGQIMSSFGFPIVVQKSFRDMAETDVVYIPSLLIGDLPAFAQANKEAVDWIRTQYRKGAIIAAACTGTLLLAETGLLDHAPATSHWAAAGLMKSHHPNVQLAERRILSFAGKGQRLITAGGASSWQDLCLYLIMRFAGMETAREVSKLFLFQWHRDGQTPYAALQRNTQHDDAIIGQAQLWLAENYEHPRALATAVETSGLNERTFNRRFNAAAGLAPSEYLQLLRLEEAKQILETMTLPVEEIAANVGYSDEASFRRLFKRVVGMTPAEYRRKYVFPTREQIEEKGGFGR